MSQRDRQWTTFFIWLAFLIAILLVWDRVLVVPVDFTGLWPQVQNYPFATDAEQLRQIVEAAQQASPEVMARVQATIQAELAWRVPFVIALSAMLIATATACTYFVWRNAGLEAYLAREAVQSAKQKRRSRIEHFVEDLDIDELDQLRERLGDEESAQHLR